MLTRGRQLIGRAGHLLWYRRRSIGEPCAVDRTRKGYQSLADEIDRLLHENLLTVWYPHSLDETYGGYHQRLSWSWPENGATNKFLVCQARLTWTAAAAAGYIREFRDRYLAYALHGLKFLDKVMRDEKFGGFHWRLDRSGRLTDKFGDDKHVYGIAFVVYAAAEIFRQTKNDRDLQVAVDAYEWLEHYAADRQDGGYFEWLRRDGSYIPPPHSASRDKRLYTLETLVGYKSMNTHLHLLEAYALLYEIWPDKDLRNRLEHLLYIVRDRIAVAPGALNLYFTPDWRAVPAHDSFGHDVEAAFLLTEAVKTLGRAEDAVTWKLARQLVDHALVWGWDEKFGGFYNKGEAFLSAHDTRKFGWVQAEGLNALLLMHERFIDENGPYFKAFTKQWGFIRNFQIDHRHGGWHTVLTREGKIASGREPNETGSIYHYVRAMVNATRALRHLCQSENGASRNSGANRACERIYN